MKVLILDGDNFQALQLTRDLGKNHKVYVGGISRLKTLSFYSKYSSGFIFFNDKSIKDFKITIRSIKENKFDLLIPTTERSCVILNYYRNNLNKINSLKIACENQEVLNTAFNKKLTYEFCKKNKIKTPLILNKDDIKLFKNDVVVVKPISSNKIDSSGNIVKTPSPKYCNKKNLKIFDDSTFLFQEFIKGESIGFFAISKKGVIINSYSHRRILDTNPSGSGSCVRESILRIDKKLMNISEKIIKNLGWTGPIMLEYIKNSSNEYFLLEINGRLWGSYCLNSFSGLNFSDNLLSLYTNFVVTNELNKPKKIVVTNEILLFYRWVKIIFGSRKNSSSRFPKRKKIFFELKYLLNKKELLSNSDYFVFFRYLWKR